MKPDQVRIGYLFPERTDLAVLIKPQGAIGLDEYPRTHNMHFRLTCERVSQAPSDVAYTLIELREEACTAVAVMNLRAGSMETLVPAMLADIVPRLGAPHVTIVVPRERELDRPLIETIAALLAGELTLATLYVCANGDEGRVMTLCSALGLRLFSEKERPT